MGLEKVKDEVLNNANKEASRIREQADNEARRIVEESEEKINDYRKKVSDETKSIIKTIKNREKASAELELKKLSLEAKKDLIEQVFAGVKNKIEKLSQAKRKELIKKLVEKAKNEIDVKLIYCSQKDMRFVEGFDAKEETIFGGIIAENADGSIRVDYSYDSLLQNLREKYLGDVAKILFG